jgi:hypothetical protein
LNAQFNDRSDFFSHKFNHVGTDTEALISHQGFTAQFYGHAFIKGLFHIDTHWSAEYSLRFLLYSLYTKMNIEE